ncbi:hypothetical protein OA88_23010 [Flavobacterium sp. JRM]|nr:hypothetical protein OA88_23010 [Flavobacterium sp. JRM]
MQITLVERIAPRAVVLPQFAQARCKCSLEAAGCGAPRSPVKAKLLVGAKPPLVFCPKDIDQGTLVGSVQEALVHHQARRRIYFIDLGVRKASKYDAPVVPDQSPDGRKLISQFGGSALDGESLSLVCHKVCHCGCFV